MTVPIQSSTANLTANLPTSSQNHQVTQVSRHPAYRREPTTNGRQYNLLRFERHEKLECHRNELWRIHEGFVHTFTWGAEGEPVPLGFWVKGDIVGCAIAQTYPYEVECLTAVTAERLDSTYRPSKEVILAHVKQSNDLLRISHRRQAETRLLIFVCWLAQRFGEAVSGGISIQIKLTHQEIADAIGLTRVTVSRLIKSLEREQKIRWTPHERVVYTKTFEQSCEHVYETEQVVI